MAKLNYEKAKRMERAAQSNRLGNLKRSTGSREPTSQQWLLLDNLALKLGYESGRAYVSARQRKFNLPEALDRKSLSRSIEAAIEQLKRRRQH